MQSVGAESKVAVEETVIIIGRLHRSPTVKTGVSLPGSLTE